MKNIFEYNLQINSISIVVASTYVYGKNCHRSSMQHGSCFIVIFCLFLTAM
jgi:hypothetical protein